MAVMGCLRKVWLRLVAMFRAPFIFLAIIEIERCLFVDQVTFGKYKNMAVLWERAEVVRELCRKPTGH